MSDALQTSSAFNAVVDAALRTLPNLQSKMNLLMHGNPKDYCKPLAEACEVDETTVRLWANGRTKKLNRTQIPTVAAYFHVCPESLVVANPERKSSKPRTAPTRAHHGTLNYHLEVLAVGEAHYVEARDAERVPKLHSRIQSGLVRPPGTMADMKFTASVHTCIGATIGAPVRYVIRVERTK